MAARYGATLVPAITTSIRPPLNVYVPGVPTPSPPIVPTPWPDPSDAPIAGMGAPDGSGRIQPPVGASWSNPELNLISTFPSGNAFCSFEHSLESDDDAPSFIAVLAGDQAALATTRSAEKEIVSASLAAFQTESRPTHFETGAGFAISGAGSLEAFLGPAATAQPHGETGWWRVEPTAPFLLSTWWPGGIPLDQTLPLLVRLTDGRWVGAAAMPRFVLSFTVDEVGAQAVIYRSMDIPFTPDTEQMMASLRAGALRREQAPELVELLRDSKHADPMLGVLAAYLHDAMGDLANVHRTAFYFAQLGQPIPFDIALLGRLEAHRDAEGLVRVRVPEVAEAEGARKLPVYMRSATPPIEGVLAGSFPWLRQGWDRLDPEGRSDLYPPGLAQLTPQLLPAPFTTLTAIGGDDLAHLLFSPP